MGQCGPPVLINDPYYVTHPDLLTYLNHDPLTPLSTLVERTDRGALVVI